MKILIVCKSLPFTYQGGIQTHTWKLTEWMVRMGHEVSILTAGSFRNGEKTLEMAGRTIIELPYLPGRRMPLVPTVAEEMAFNMAARKWLLKNQYGFDIIHLQGRSGNLFLADKKKVKRPVVTTFHGLIEIEQRFSGAKTRQSPDGALHRFFSKKMEQMAMKNSDALVAVSDEMVEELKGRFAKSAVKTTKIYNGVDVPSTPSQPKPISDPNLLLFVGRLSVIKGVNQLVESMQLLPQSIQLVMVGDGDARPGLEKQIKELGLGHRIVLTGSLPAPKVVEWMERCHALVLPSFHETQGIVLMEANACGKPVIAHAVGGMKEVVVQGENGLLIPTNQPSDIAGAVNQLFQNPNLAAQMGLRGKQLVKNKFSWENIAEQTIHVYGSVMARHHSLPTVRRHLFHNTTLAYQQI